MMTINKKVVLVSTLIIVSLSANAYLTAKCLIAEQKFKKAQEVVLANQANQKILQFTDMFIDKILKASGDIDFETRLNLETAVRDLKDPDVLGQWQKFTESETNAQAQVELKNLLSLLIKKMQD